MNLNIDDEAVEALFVELKQQNYPGTLEDLTLSIEKASTATASRQFWLQVGNLQPGHPFRQWFDRLSSHFADITYYGTGALLWSGVIALCDRKLEKSGRESAINSVVLDFRGAHNLDHIRVVAKYCVSGEDEPRRIQRFSIKPNKAHHLN